MLKHILFCAALSAPLYVYAANEQETSSTSGQVEQKTETSKSSAIKGLVRNNLGQPIAGATVTLKRVAGEVVGTTTTDAEGQFNFAANVPGTYAVLSDKAGFEPGTTNVTLQVGLVTPPLRWLR